MPSLSSPSAPKTGRHVSVSSGKILEGRLDLCGDGGIRPPEVSTIRCLQNWRTCDRTRPSPHGAKDAMNNPAASRGVSKPKTLAKVLAPRGGELDPERLKGVYAIKYLISDEAQLVSPGSQSGTRNPER